MAQNVVIDFKAEVDGLAPAFTALQKLGKITEDDVKAFNAANAAQKELAKSADANSKSFDRLATSASNVKKNIVDGAINKAIEGTGKLIDKNTVATKKYDDSIRGLKQQYKDLLSLAIKNGENSPIGKQALKDAGELKDRIGDLAATTKAYGSDTATFDAIGQGIGTIGAGFQAAEGAQALFGEGGEALQKTMVRLQAVMALTNGLQQIQNNLQAESALRVRLSSIQQAIYTTVVGTSTGAMKAFRIALVSTGIGALVLGLILLIANFDKVSASVKSFVNKFDFIKKSVDILIQTFSPLIDAIKSVAVAFGFIDSAEVESLEKTKANLKTKTDLLRQAADEELARKSAAGKFTADLDKQFNDAELALIKKQNKAAVDLFIQKAKDTNNITKEGIDELALLVKESHAREQELEVKNIGDLVSIQQRGLAARKAQIDARLVFAEKGSANELKLKLQQIEAERQIENSNASLTQAQINLNNQKATLARRQAFEEQKAFELQGLIDIEAAKLARAEAGSKAEIDFKRKILDIELELNLNNSKISQTQKDKLTAESGQKELALIKQYGDAQVKLAEETAFKIQNEGTKRIDKKKADLDAEFEYYNTMADLEFKSSSQSFNRIEALRVEKFTRALQLLDAELAKVKETNAGILASEEKLQAELRANISKDPANRLLYEAAIKESQERVKTSVQTAADAEVEINRKKNVAITSDDLAAAANKKERNLKLADDIQQNAQYASDFISKANQMVLDQQLERYSAESAGNKANLDNKIINQKEYERVQKEINDKTEKAKVKAAKRERDLQSVMVIINTAVAVSKALATTGLPLAIPFIAATVALGALQLAALQKAKIPEFAKGTNYAPKGWAWVGEQGPELVNLRGGEKIKTASESKAFQMEYFNNNTVSGVVDKSPVLSQKGKDASNLFQNEPAFAMDYNMLSSMISKGIGGQLSKMPITNLSLDKNGFSVSVHENNNKTNYLDNRYSTN